MGNKMNKVLPGLYIGSARDARDVEELRENKISHILSVFENSKPELPDKEYMCLSVADSPSQNIVCYFSQCNVFIHKARRAGNVLVHCQMGVSRSATIVVAYLMTVTRLSWKDAVAALKAVRPFVSPNLGFQKQLMIYEKKYVEEERTRLKTIFPLSQFNDAAHCIQLLETYRLARLRTEQPMEVDVYPLPLDAYGAKDFASLRRESTPGSVVLCGPVPDPTCEEDCLSRRLERIQLTETFASVDTFSCGTRPTSVIIFPTKSPEVGSPSASSLSDVQEDGLVERERISGNALLSGPLKNPVLGSRMVDPKVSDDAAAVEMLFSDSVDVSKNSGNDDAGKNPMRELTLQHVESLDAASVESMFSNSGSKHSVDRGSSEVKRDGPGVKESPQQIRVSNRIHLTEKELREIGRAYLREHVRIWHDLSDDDDDDDDDGRWSAAGNNNPAKNKIASNDPTRNTIAINDPTRNTIASNDPTRNKIASNDPTRNRIASSDPTRNTIASNNPTRNKIASNDPTRNRIASSNPIQLIKISSAINPTETTIASNDPSQFQTTTNEPTQLIKITSNGPPQDTIASSDPTQRRLSGGSVEVVSVLPRKSRLDLLFQS